MHCPLSPMQRLLKFKRRVRVCTFTPASRSCWMMLRQASARAGELAENVPARRCKAVAPARSCATASAPLLSSCRTTGSYSDRAASIRGVQPAPFLQQGGHCILQELATPARATHDSRHGTLATVLMFCQHADLQQKCVLAEHRCGHCMHLGLTSAGVTDRVNACLCTQMRSVTQPAACEVCAAPGIERTTRGQQVLHALHAAVRIDVMNG